MSEELLTTAVHEGQGSPQAHPARFSHVERRLPGRGSAGRPRGIARRRAVVVEVFATTDATTGTPTSRRPRGPVGVRGCWSTTRRGGAWQTPSPRRVSSPSAASSTSPSPTSLDQAPAPGRDLRRHPRPRKRRRRDPLRRRGWRRCRGLRRRVCRPIQRQGSAGQRRVAVPPTSRHRRRRSSRPSLPLQAAGVFVLAADGAGDLELDRALDAGTARSGRRHGCSATRPAGSQPRCPRSPTTPSQCRSMAGPRALTSRRLRRSASTPRRVHKRAKRHRPVKATVGYLPGVD